MSVVPLETPEKAETYAMGDERVLAGIQCHTRCEALSKDKASVNAPGHLVTCRDQSKTPQAKGSVDLVNVDALPR